MATADRDLRRIVADLADLSDGELHALVDTNQKAPPVAPGLLAWFEQVCDRE